MTWQFPQACGCIGSLGDVDTYRRAGRTAPRVPARRRYPHARSHPRLVRSRTMRYAVIWGMASFVWNSSTVPGSRAMSRMRVARRRWRAVTFVGTSIWMVSSADDELPWNDPRAWDDPTMLGHIETFAFKAIRSVDGGAQ